MNMHDQEYYWYWFINIPEIGNRTRMKLMERYGHPARIYDCQGKELEEFLTGDQALRFDQSKDYSMHENHLKKLHEQGIQFIHWESKEYPERFRHIFDPPYGFYLKGKLPPDHMPAIAMVGSRRTTPYGRKMAEIFAGRFAEEGIAVISGMAAGIDPGSHRSTLKHGGITLGILGGGIDTMYPKENWDLYLDMYERGGIMSESNLGVQNMAYQFPMRNRLISGISDGVLVCEAALKSGSLITADQGMEQGKYVFAIPGRLSDEMSKGCNHLIAQGAFVAETPEDVIDILCGKESNDKAGEVHGISSVTDLELSENEKLIMTFLDEINPLSFDTLLQKCLLNFGQLQQILVSLELKGYIIQPIQNMYIKKIM